jgi:hypothetical protein
VRRHRLLAVLSLTPVALGGCSAGGGPEGAVPGSTEVAAGVPTGPAYNSVVDLARTLTDKGLPCTLQYPGLHDDVTDAELSICTVAGDQAYLRVWRRPDAISLFLANPQSRTGTVVVGANWTISLTTAATAQLVSTALGAIVPTP